MIPYGRQSIDEHDVEAVISVLRSDFLTQGPAVPDFENALSNYCHAQYAVAVNSATSALHIACLALGVGVGDRVWTSAITFVASSNCALYCGANIDFVDIDPDTYNLSVERLKEKLQLADKSGELPKVVIPVHLCGQSCDMAEIQNLAKQYGFKIIEDASHAIGGKYMDGPIGSGRYSDITVFSFHPVKIITTCEGGVALTNDEELAVRMRLFRSHGITNDPSLMSPRSKSEIWNYQQIELGFNYRMTDLQAALGKSQMQRLDKLVERRHELANRYDSLLVDFPLKRPWQHPETYSAWHLYVIRVDKDTAKLTQREVYEGLRKVDIAANLHYIPVYRQPYYERLGFKPGYCPESESYFSEAITIPLYADLSEQQQDIVVMALAQLLKI